MSSLTRRCPGLREGLLALAAASLLGLASAVQANGVPDAAAQVPLDPAARLPAGDHAGESWDLWAGFEDGSLLLARILLTNEGPGERNAVATGLWVESNGTTHAFDNVRRRSEWQLAPDRMRLDIGSTHLDLHAPLARYSITKKRIALDLQLPLGTNVALPGDFEGTRGGRELLAFAAPAVGNVRLRGEQTARRLSGRAHLVHAWSRKEPRLRRLGLFAFDAAGASLLILARETPAGAQRAWAALRAGDAPARAAHAFTIRTAGTLEGKRPEGYPVPAALHFEGPGVQGQATLGPALWERDLLGAFPQPLRSLVRWTLRSRPLRVWARAAIEVTLRPGSGGSPYHFQGRGGASVDFTDNFGRR